MILRDLIAALPGAAVRGPVEGPVGSLALDSRRVAAGDVFFALAGVHADGARFVADAVRAGALAVVTARGAAVPDGVTHVEVDEPRLALAQAACALYGDPSRAMRVVAVTGTNGKTTTTYLLESIYAAAGWSAGVIGTTGIRIAGESRPSAFTTPESPQLQALLAEMRDRGVEAVAMEASSHALVQRRTWGLACGAAIFTNLTQDHLDYHGTMAAYLDAKLMLFDGRNGAAAHSTGAGGAGPPPIPTAIVNADDGACERVCEAARAGGMRVLRYGDARVADVRLVSVRAVSAGLELCVAFAGTERAFVLPMLGRFNAHNAAGAIGAALALGVEPGVIVRGLSDFAGVPGRLERVSTREPFAVAVDYAHTPDALERALAACREHASGRVLCVFGCGGDRDRGKRPQMGAIAARLADRAWVTNDNPRSERPEDIADQIVAGAPAGALEVMLDRRAAIAAAIRAAGSGDLVLIAGKGHESTQTIGSEVLPFDDRAVAREALGALR